MSSSLLKGIKICGVAWLIPLSVQVAAQSNPLPLQVSLKIEPNQCVAVRRGSTCYQNVQINWQASRSDSYCLYQMGNEQPLKCWANSNSGNFKYELVTKEGVSYTIRYPSSEQALAIERLDVAWVYKRTKRTQSTWRMF